MIDIFLFAPWIGVMGLGVWIMWLYKKVPVKLFTGTKKDEMILMQITEDGKAIFGKAKIEAGMAVKETGGIRNKQSFSYLLTPYSTVTEPRSKTTIGITYGNYGVVLSPSAHDKGNALKAAGFGDFDDLEKGKKEVNGENKDKEKGTDIEISYNTNRTLRISDIYDFLHKIIRSDIIESRIQRRTAQEIKRRRRSEINPMTIMLILIGAAIALYIISMIMKPSDATAIGQAIAEALKGSGAAGTSIS